MTAAAPQPVYKRIAIERLLLDEDNPRFSQRLSQDEILASFARSTKTVKLAGHIADNGISPLEVAAVSETDDKNGRFLVHEGNRRLSALKLLNNPHLAGAQHAKYQRLSRQAKVEVPTKLHCAVFQHAEDAQAWVVLRHSGGLDGAGVLDWDPIQRGRFNIRHGIKEQYASAYRFLDHGISQGWVTEDEANGVTVSNLGRVLKDTEVQKLFGVLATKDRLEIALRPEAAKRLTRRLVTDWAKKSGRSVEEIYNQQKRTAYAQGVRDQLHLQPDPGLATATTNSELATGAPARPVARTSRPAGADRGSLVPRTFHVRVPATLRRVEVILTELKGLSLGKYTNACAVLFRTFVEASVHYYLDKNHLPINERDYLHTLALRAAAHMEKLDPSCKPELKPVKAAMSAAKGHLFAFQTLNEYVHNPRWHPISEDLKNHWDNFAPFFQRLWAQ